MSKKNKNNKNKFIGDIHNMIKKNKNNKNNKKKVNIYEEELQEILDDIHADEEKNNKITPEQQDLIDSMESFESLGENLGKKPEERTDVEDKTNPELEKSFEEIANEIKANKKAKKSEAAKNIKKEANLSSSEEDEDDAAKKIKEEKKAKKAQKQQDDIDFILDESDFSDTKLGGKQEQDTDNKDKKKSKKKYNDLIASSLMGTAYDLKPQNNDDTTDITEYAIKKFRGVETEDNKTLSLLIDSLEESLIDGCEIELDDKKIKDIVDVIVKDPSNNESIMEVAKMFKFEDFQSKLMEAKLDLETVSKVSRLAEFAAIPEGVHRCICSSLQYTIYTKAKELKDDELLLKMDEHIPFLNPQTLLTVVKEFSNSNEIKTFIKNFEWIINDTKVYDTIDKTFYRYSKMFSINHDEFSKLLMNYSNDMDFLLDRESLKYFIDREYSDMEELFISYMNDMED